jgi:stress response protein YsnF
MAQTVVGFFDNTNEAREAVEMLKRQGFTDAQIDLRSNNLSNSGTDEMVGGQKMDGSNRSDYRDNDSDDNGITKFFKSLFGGNDDEADRYSRVGRNSGAIVTVHCRSEEESERAADTLDDNGAVDVDERSAQYASTTGRNENAGLRDDMGSTDRSGLRSDLGDSSQSLRDDLSTRQPTSGDADQTIERVQENLEVGKREVERGSTRIRSRIVERPIEEHVRLREEHIRIEHQPVNRPASEADLNNLRDQNIELTERAEVPVVNKEARVVEEIRVSKDVEERDETIRDTVRNTEIDIDQNNDLNNREGRRGNDTNLRSTDL